MTLESFPRSNTNTPETGRPAEPADPNRLERAVAGLEQEGRSQLQDLKGTERWLESLASEGHQSDEVNQAIQGLRELISDMEGRLAKLKDLGGIDPAAGRGSVAGK